MNQQKFSLSQSKVVGFKEHPDFLKPNLFQFPSIHKRLPDNDDKFDNRALEYLKAGFNLTSYRGFDEDIFDDSRIIKGTYSIFTDGSWLWYKYVIYYYENYHVLLPHEFLESVRMNNFVLPVIDPDQTSELLRQKKEIFC